MNKRDINWKKPPREGCVFVDIVDGVEGDCLCIGDESGSLRVSGPKPWGGGETKQRFTVELADLRRIIAEYDKQATP